MAKTKNAPQVKVKNGMVKVLCPKNGNQPTWANIGPKKGAVCTKCSGTGHDVAR